MNAVGGTWAALVLSSFVPATADGLVRSEREIDWTGAWERFVSSMNAKARVGARVALLLALTAPIWALGRLASMASLSPDERARLLDRLLAHRLYVVRELVLMLKVCACLAMFREGEVRARTSYDRPLAAKVRLPMLAREAT